MADARLTLIHSNRIERLADWLAGVLRELPSDAAWPRPGIVVPHAGLARWLEQALAARLGIAFGLDMVLPGQFLAALGERVLGAGAGGQEYGVGALGLRILGQLEAARSPSVPLPAPLRELASTTDAQGRLAIATALAERYDRYLTHWPDLLRRWERAPDSAALPWQAHFWRQLRTSIALPHRGERLQQLLVHLRDRPLDAQLLPDTLHLFGLNLMPAPYWRVFEALSAHVPLIVYLPEPGAEPAIGAGHALPIDSIEEAAFDEPEEPDEAPGGHPLLERYGALQRAFVRLVFASDIERDLRPSVVDLDGRCRLQQLQRSLLIGHTDGENWPAIEGDDSLLIHACGGPWRELEALRDMLLARFAGDPTLALSDVVVMVPDPALYAPYCASVFGHEDPGLRLPYRVIERGALAPSGRLEAFLAWLALPQRRVVLADVLAFAGRRDVQARFALTRAELDAIEQWYGQAGVRWGLDGSERRAFGAGDDDDGTFALAARRLLLGVAHGPGVDELAGVAPLDLAEGQGAAALGRFLELVGTLVQLRDALRGTRTIDAWCRELAAAFDALFADLDDDPDADARANLADALADLAEDAERASLRDQVPGALLPALVRARLAGDSGRGAAGAITVCGLVPLRSVPFRVVALLGLDEQGFPRRTRARPFECVAGTRLGERHIASDDRQAFLEAIVSARDLLHLSYNAQDAANGSTQAPSTVLLELHDYLVSRAAGDAAAWRMRPAKAPWWMTHTLSPFDRGAFRPVHARGSFAQHWAQAAAALGEQAVPGPAFACVSKGPADNADLTVVELTTRLARPARAWLRRAGIALPAEPSAPDLEPGRPDSLRWSGLRARTLALLAAESRASDHALTDQLLREGGLPAGAQGRFVAQEIVAQARTMQEAILAWGLARIGVAPLEIELVLDGARITGSIAGVAQGRLARVRQGKLHAEHLLSAWVESLVLRVAGAPLEDAVLLGYDNGPVALRLSPPADAAATMSELVALAQRAGQEPLPLFPRTGRRYAESQAKHGDAGRALDAARSTWTGSTRERGERDDPELALFTRDWADPLAPPFAELALALHGPWLAACKVLAP